MGGCLLLIPLKMSLDVNSSILAFDVHVANLYAPSHKTYLFFTELHAAWFVDQTGSVQHHDADT